MSSLALSARVRDAAQRPAVIWTASGLVAIAVSQTLHLPCPFRSDTGWDCPVCGSTRALENIARLRFGAALKDNAVLVLFCLVIGATVLLSCARVGWVQTAKSRVAAWSPWIPVAGLVAWTLIRNMPGMLWLSPDR